MFLFAALVASATAQVLSNACASASATCPKGTVCKPDPKVCVTTPCPQFACVAVDDVPPIGACFSCATPNVRSFFDGCNTCSCATAGPVCTQRFCIAVAHDPSLCTNQCDGFRTTDGCLCVGQQKTNCSAAVTPSPSPSPATPSPSPSPVPPVPPPPKKCGCGLAACGRGQVCEDNVCRAYTAPALPAGVADGTPLCIRTGQPCCGASGLACGVDEVCDSNKCVPAAQCSAPTSTCWNCNTTGVTSFFDGCNMCTCARGGVATCTTLNCILSLPRPTECARQCDGFVTADDGKCGTCTCVGGVKTKCSTCGVGSRCTTAGCVAVVPPKTPCDAQPCGADAVCINEPKVCITTPCPQFRCEKVAQSCADKPCQAGLVCVDEPKACVTTPCPQFRCERPQPIKPCGCDDPSQVCGSGMTCRDNQCQALKAPQLPTGALDGTVLCLRTGQPCCGDGFSCGDGEVCHKNACVKASQCGAVMTATVTTPAPTRNGDTCVTCKTMQDGASFFDGCNTCSCKGGVAVCTKRSCITLVTDRSQCSLRCDGAQTTDDAVCGTCTCVGGVKTACTKCKGKCTSSVTGRSVCSDDSIIRETAETRGSSASTAAVSLVGAAAMALLATA